MSEVSDVGYEWVGEGEESVKLARKLARQHEFATALEGFQLQLTTVAAAQIVPQAARDGGAGDRDGRSAK